MYVISEFQQNRSAYILSQTLSLCKGEGIELYYIVHALFVGFHNGSFKIFTLILPGIGSCSIIFD